MIWHDWYLLMLIPCGIAIVAGWVAMWAKWAMEDDPTPLRAMMFFGAGIGIPAAIVITVIFHFTGD